MIDWSWFYFWELFKLDALTIFGCLGVLASIPVGAVIGKRLRAIIKDRKKYNNQKQTKPK